MITTQAIATKDLATFIGDWNVKANGKILAITPATLAVVKGKQTVTSYLVVSGKRN